MRVDEAGASNAWDLSSSGWSQARLGSSVSAILAGVGLLGGCLLVLALTVVLPESALLRTVAFGLAGASLPVLLAGIVLLEVGEPWIRACGGIGLALCAGGLILFVGWFPSQWSAALAVPNVFAVVEYLLGLGLMATGAAGALFWTVRRGALGSDQRIEPASETARAGASDGGAFTWGGVSRSRPSVRLVVDEAADGVQLEGEEGYLVRVEDGSSVNFAVDTLLALQGRGQITVRREAGVGTQAKRLHTIRMWDAIELAEVQPWWKKLVPPYR